MTFEKLLVPKKVCLLEAQLKNIQQRRLFFVRLLRNWAHCTSGSIPYVWGGCSFIGVTKKNKFVEKMLTHGNQTMYSFFTNPDCKTEPKTGLDCTGLIACAAQIAGIPYFFKNSTTIAQHLDPLEKGEQIREGDIIWINRHAMVVSNLKKNLLVEARHYSHGYGIVHEIPLCQQFKDIKSYEQLADTVFNKKKISRINKDGKIVEVIPQISIFKLSTVWKKKVTART